MNLEDTPGRHQYIGKYKAFVRDNNDPEMRGRIRCYCPQIMGDEDVPDQWLGWAEPCFPWMGGISTGDFGPPYTRKEQIEDTGSEYFGVWVEFQEGNLDFPIWVGTFTIAPTTSADSVHTQTSSSGMSGAVGGGVIGSELSESDDGPLNPPRTSRGKELRLITKSGRDIVIGVDGGGALVIGPSGAHITGIQVSINGKAILSSSTG